MSEVKIILVGKRTCVECGRVFNLLDQLDSDEWSFGHDCEV